MCVCIYMIIYVYAWENLDNVGYDEHMHMCVYTRMCVCMHARMYPLGIARPCYTWSRLKVVVFGGG